jgi:Lipocalin-like domain
MSRRSILSISAMTGLALALLSDSAIAQQQSLKQQLAGTWTVVSSSNVAPDGSKRQIFGANPKGVLVLDASGRYAQIIVRPDRPKFKANNRLDGTPEENKAAILGTTATFGTWSVDEASKSLVRHIEGSLFPNQEGTDAKTSIVSLTGDELKTSNPSAGSGGTTDTAYRRVK